MNDLRSGQTTWEGLARKKLGRLWRAVFETDPTPEAEKRMSRMLAPWGAETIPSRPAWPSDIGDDHSPFEFSLVLSRRAAEIRFLVEAQGREPTLAGQREAALALTYALREDGADLGRFERVQDLLLPRDVTSGRFALWHASRLSGAPEHKAYFNPEILGEERARSLVDEAMGRLGLREPWRTLQMSSEDRIRYFALELSPDARARVKVYFYRFGADATELANLVRGVRDARPEMAVDFCRAITGSEGPWKRVPLCFYFSFVEGEPGPVDMAIQIPIRFFASDDAAARDRVLAYLEKNGVSPAPYARALDAMADRPLDAGSGLQSYVSVRPVGNDFRLVSYLAIEAFEVAPRRDPAKIAWLFADSRRPPQVLEDERALTQ